MSILNKILIKARKQVLGERAGNNSSLFLGEGYDFVELREYVSGDDIRHIDWNITAKMQNPYIKVFKEERELNIVAVSVLNGSVHFGSKKFKQELIAEIVAHIGYSATKNSDLFSSYIFTDEMNYHSIPSKKINKIEDSVKKVLEFDALYKKVDFEFLSKTLFQRLRRKSLIIIIGDFFEIPDFKLLAKKHELISILVRDKLEENPPIMNFSSFIDPESGNSLDGMFNKKSVYNYAKKVMLHDKKLFTTLRKDKIKYSKIYTDSDINLKLIELFNGN